MPNRILREGILSSDRVEKLDYPAEVFYRRLLSKVDDHGLFDARPAVLRAALFPLRLDRVREADISRWLVACQTAGLILFYEAEGRPYIKALDTRWQVRSEPKYPLPPEGSLSPPSVCEQLQTTDNSCEQLNTKSLSLSLSLLKTNPLTPLRGKIRARASPKEPQEPPGFAEFWAIYPKRVARGKAVTAWQKIGVDGVLLAKILAAIKAQSTSSQWRAGGGEYIPYPSSWLNARRWEDETPKPMASTVDVLKKRWLDAGHCGNCGGKWETIDGITRCASCSLNKT